jgi:hypothetical protein
VTAQRRRVVLLSACSCLMAQAALAEPFRQLRGPEIRSRFTGMELTDEAHWSYRFEQAGRLASFSTGRAGTGAWRVEADELCLDREVDGLRCFEVWVSGKRVELRREPGRPTREFCEGRKLDNSGRSSGRGAQGRARCVQ